ncbi:MAG: SpoIIE family protein phosphatase, partial [Bacteroidota bacterium]
DQQELKTTFDEAIKIEKLKKEKEELLTQVTGTNKELEEKVQVRTKELQEINHKLIESLEYAENIQKTILSDPEELEGIFENSMIYYKPLDIVSGDFYLLRRLGKRAVIGAFDCTGHGVPGAMLSMLGNAAIDNALASNIVRPSELMVTVNNKINKQLRASQNRVGDGMDGSFMLYNKESNKISFSGAKSDIILFRNGELERIRGNRLSIGERFMDVDQSFDQHNIDATGITEIYMYSDGYRDQINEAYNKRFNTSRFHALLNRIHEDDFMKQSQILDTEFNKWKGTADQTDDIMILGFRLQPN